MSVPALAVFACLLSAGHVGCVHVVNFVGSNRSVLNVKAVDQQSDIVNIVEGNNAAGIVMPIQSRAHWASAVALNVELHGASELQEEAQRLPAPATKHQYTVFIIKVVIGFGIALVLLVMYNSMYEKLEALGIKTSHVYCLVFICMMVSVDLSTKAAVTSSGHFNFSPAVCVIITEGAKFVISCFLLGLSLSGKEAREKLVLPSAFDVLILLVPAAVFTANNIILFKAIERVPLATFAVIRETRLVWTALIWFAVFRVRLGVLRWVAIIGVLVGCSANQIPAMLRSEFTGGVIWSIVLAFLNATGGITNEYAMKYKAAMDINLQNMILYAGGSLMALVYVAIFNTDVLRSPSAFFAGFAPQCLQILMFQVLTGLTVSRILKHVESVTKGMVAALGGPIIIFLGTVLLKTKLHVNEVIAALVVVFSCVLFVRQGALYKPADAPKEAAPAKGKPM